MEPLLLDVPAAIETDRLRLRVPRAGDGAIVLPIVRASLAELKPWLPWANDGYDASSAEVWCRRAAGNFLLRHQFHYLIFEAATDRFAGAVGVMNLRWDVVECEVGYWLATPFVGRGYMAEAVRGVTAMAFASLSAERVVIKADADNRRSRSTAERAGFTLDGTLRRWGRNTAGQLADECVYAVVR